MFGDRVAGEVADPAVFFVKESDRHEIGRTPMSNQCRVPDGTDNRSPPSRTTATTSGSKCRTVPAGDDEAHFVLGMPVLGKGTFGPLPPPCPTTADHPRRPPP